MLWAQALNVQRPPDRQSLSLKFSKVTLQNKPAMRRRRVVLVGAGGDLMRLTGFDWCEVLRITSHDGIFLMI